MGEERFLQQLYLEEQYGSALPQQQTQQRRDAEADRRRLADGKAAIGYVYEDGEPAVPASPPPPPPPPEPEQEEDSDEDMDDIDLGRWTYSASEGLRTANTVMRRN